MSPSATISSCSSIAAVNVTSTIFEKYSDLGGILRHGIPSFRLSEDILDSTIQKILNLGIGVEYNKEVGKNISLKEISEKYDAVFIAIGANVPWKMGIEGEVLNGVYGRKYFT